MRGCHDRNESSTPSFCGLDNRGFARWGRHTVLQERSHSASKQGCRLFDVRFLGLEAHIPRVIELMLSNIQ